MTLFRTIGFAFALLAPFAALAQIQPDRDDPASAPETRRVTAEIAKFGCKTSKPIEKENNVFEVDDAVCGTAGQFDIKLDSQFRITSMTRDD